MKKTYYAGDEYNEMMLKKVKEKEMRYRREILEYKKKQREENEKIKKD